VKGGASPTPFDIATTRSVVDRYHAQAALRDALTPLVAQLDRNLAVLAADVRDRLGDSYETARDASTRDDEVKRALAPAVQHYGKAAVTRKRNKRPDKLRQQVQLEAITTADKAVKAKARADKAAAKAAAAKTDVAA
jgi:hypothetical protein